MAELAAKIDVRRQDIMRRKKRQPDSAAGILAIVMGIGSVCIAVFSSLSSVQRYGAAASGLMLLSWGLIEVIAAKKWKQESEEEHYATTPEEIRESEQEEKLEKSGSMGNVFELLGRIFLFVIVAGAIVVGYLFWTRPR